MPKVTVEFNLPEEQEEYEMYSRAGEFHSCLWELDQSLRAGLKYGHTYASIEDALEKLRDQLHDGLGKGL